MPQLYEGMFLLDNDLVREGWDPAKAKVTDLIELNTRLDAVANVGID